MKKLKMAAQTLTFEEGCKRLKLETLSKSAGWMANPITKIEKV